ncbi:MAG: hypothetical protein WA484_02790 [Solirubrobacteraceae bacterium]
MKRRRPFDHTAVAFDRAEAGTLDSAAEHPPADVAVIVRSAALGDKDEVVPATRLSENLGATQLLSQLVGDLDTALRSLGLERPSLPVAVELTDERDRSSVEIDIAPDKTKDLPQPATRLSSKRKQQPVSPVHRVDEPTELLGVQHSLGASVFDSGPLDAVEHREWIPTDQTKVARCVREDRAEHCEVPADRPAPEVGALLRRDECRHVRGRDVDHAHVTKPSAQVLQTCRIRVLRCWP